MSRPRFSLLLILLLSLTFVVAYEEESEESNEDDQETSSSDESDEDADTTLMTSSKCANADQFTSLAKMCCHYHLHLDKASEYCNTNEDLSDIDFSTEKGKIDGTMRLVGCFFRRKNYIKSRDKLNMKQVKADAAKLSDPDKAKFMIDMYTTCEIEGKRALQMYEGYSRHRQSKKDAFPTRHQMYMHVIYACLNNFFVEKKCPYFYWFSENSGDNRKCKRYAQECKVIIRKGRK